MPPRWNRRKLPCNFFNTPRGCRHGDECRFSHESPTSPSSGSSVASDDYRRGARSPSAAGGGRGNLMSLANTSESGLATFIGTGTDAVFNPLANDAFSPYDAKALLMKIFLKDGYRFQRTNDIYRFVKLLDSIDTRNPSWSSEDGQGMFNMLSNSNGLLRVMEIIVWKPISTNTSANHFGTLSFQRSYVPLLKFLSSEVVTKSTLHHRVNSIYSVITNNMECFIETVQSCMTEIVDRRDFKNPQSLPAPSDSMLGFQVFGVLINVLYECLSRFKNLSAEHPSINKLVEDLQKWVETFIVEIQRSPTTFNGPFSQSQIEPLARDQIINHRLQVPLSRLVQISAREENRVSNMKEKKHPQAIRGSVNEGIIAHTELTYDPPGWLRDIGPRHDNDHEHIDNITVPPTQDELLSKQEPYLPANLDGAMHHLPQRSMERHLDIQFRLLREELIAPLRIAIQLVVSDFKRSTLQKTKLSELIEKRGGKYRNSGTENSIIFGVFTNVGFGSIKTDKRGVGVELECDTPPGPARNTSASARVAYWERMGGKRLMTGGLIALVWMTNRSTTIELGTITSTTDDLSASARVSRERIRFRVSFFNSDFELKVVKFLYRKTVPEGTLLVIESPVLYEAIRPFLESLRVVPENIPFANHLVRPFNRSVDTIPPPRFAQLAGFTYELGPLFPEETGIASLKLDVRDPASIENAKEVLSRSRLDPSQADAVLDTLSREVSLIQGPPGTGKSYTGVELLRVLLPCAKPHPILLIAFTNHALDHMLHSILDAGITRRIIRMGRSNDERIKGFNIDELEKGAGRGSLSYIYGGGYRALKNQEKEIEDFINKIATPGSDSSVDSPQILYYLGLEYPDHEDVLNAPRNWIREAYERDLSDNLGGVWRKKAPASRKAEVEDFSLYAFWRSAKDLDFITAATTATRKPPLKSVKGISPSNAYFILQNIDGNTSTEANTDKANTDDTSVMTDNDSSAEDEENEEDLEPWQLVTQWTNQGSTISSPQPQHPVPIREPVAVHQHKNDAKIMIDPESNPLGFFQSHDCDTIPTVPSTNRPLSQLLQSPLLWSMSKNERNRLHLYWVSQIKEQEEPRRQDEYSRMRTLYAKLFAEDQEVKEESRRQLMKNVDIIGCTTTGAAKLTSLLNGLAPRILLVEEAGQVLEAHVLGSLASSLEHVILIGDPLQLRPTLNNYSLSMDSKIGNKLYRFDMSLMERLSTSGFPMSRIDVQRRMRPEISNILRKTLYSGLIDHERVKEYSSVRGMGKDMFFLHHQNKENDDGDDTASKYNTFEVNIIKDLVLYLLRQGYSKDGDIVVLCAYLGQLARVRDALSKEVVVLLDDRDVEELSRQQDEKDGDGIQLQPEIEHVKVSKQVRIRTVDNYQGEEATIVILSLVRNAGEGKKQTIGFLRSINRTNVSLSRAKEGLYILGNADQLRDSGSKMWRGVVEELEENNYLGNAFPIKCERHPDFINYINKPNQIWQVAPDGGCMRPCGTRLECGHICPYKCHPDDPKHVLVKCHRPCPKLCIRGHPCAKECWAPCGDCNFPIFNVELPCGHTEATVPCYMMDRLGDVYCKIQVEKKLLYCEHSTSMSCSSPPDRYKCTKACGGILGCCGKNCKSTCGNCQEVKGNEKVEGQETERINHKTHPCQKPLYCAHLCPLDCGPDHKCTTTCQERCRQECVHTSCMKNCSTPCAPCMEPCTWDCPHQQCPVPCGSVCVRLPCDLPCDKTLECSHPCPSACGEDCSIQRCPSCASPDHLNQVVDFIMQRTLADVLEEGDEDDILITLPKCQHTFTMETLDGHCGIKEWYTQRNGKWAGLQAPQDTQMGIRKPPVCPTCRQAITSPRYGRIFKAADLHVLNQNIISAMDKQLINIHRKMDAIPRETLVDAITSQTSDTAIDIPSKTQGNLNKSRKAVLSRVSDTPLDHKYLQPNNVELFRLSHATTTMWNRIVKPVFTVYSDVMLVASTRSSHVKAWEAAFNCLYQREMDQNTIDLARAPRNPTEHALRMAKMTVGLPKPIADRRYLVEAFWVSLEIRLILVNLVIAWFNAVQVKGNNYPAIERTNMGTYGLFILNSCRVDALRAYDIAQQSQTRRQMTSSMVYQLRIQLENSRFNIELSRLSGAFKTEKERNRLEKQAHSNMVHLIKAAKETVRDHSALLSEDKETWLKENFDGKVQVMLEEWEKIIRSIRMDTFYQPVSLEEKLSIVRGLRAEFTHTGHFFECPNGHVYAIGECGGATQTSRCPECGASVGGSGHTLDRSNRRATEFEQMLSNEGARQSPWAWGR